MSELNDIVQMIRLTNDSFSFIFKFSKCSSDLIEKIIKAVAGLLEHEKLTGKTSLKNLLLKGGDLQVLKVAPQDFEKIKKPMKKHGIAYALIKDTDDSGYVKVLFHTEATPRINEVINKLNDAEIMDFAKYMTEDGGKNTQSVLDFLEKEKSVDLENAADNSIASSRLDELISQVTSFADGKREGFTCDDIVNACNIKQEETGQVISYLKKTGYLSEDGEGKLSAIMDTEAYMERIRKYKKLSQYANIAYNEKQGDISCITVSNVMVTEENERAWKTRIPGTYGDNARFLWISKDRASSVFGGKGILTYLKNDEYYSVETKNGETKKMKGRDIAGYYSVRTKDFANSLLRKKKKEKKTEKTGTDMPRIK